MALLQIGFFCQTEVTNFGIGSTCVFVCCCPKNQHLFNFDYKITNGECDTNNETIRYSDNTKGF